MKASFFSTLMEKLLMKRHPSDERPPTPRVDIRHLPYSPVRRAPFSGDIFMTTEEQIDQIEQEIEDVRA